MNKTKLIKLIATIAVLSLFALTAAAIVLANHTDAVIAIDDNGNKYEHGKIHAMPKSISLIDDGSENNGGLSLRASVNPLNATNKVLEWSVAWSNPSSEWALGKTIADYLLSTVNGDTVTLDCKNPFGEPVIVTARSKDNPDAVATCVVNCMRRPTAFNAEFKINNSKYVTIDSGIIRVRLPGAYNSATSNHEYSAMSDSGDVNYTTSIEYNTAFTVNMEYKITKLRGLANRKFNDDVLANYELGQGEPYLPYSIISDDYNGRELGLGVNEIVQACFGHSISSEEWFSKIDSMASDINAFSDYAADLDIHFEATNGRKTILSFKVYFTASTM